MTLEPPDLLPDGRTEPPAAAARFRRWWLVVGVGLGLAAVLAALWLVTPVGEWVRPRALAAMLAELRGDPLAAIWAPLLFALLCLAMIPLVVLLGATQLAFGGVEGTVIAAVGALLGGTLSFWLGRWAGITVISRVFGSRVSEFGAAIGHRGLLAVLAVRLVPVAPFGVSNLIAGVVGIRYVDFIVGSAIGLTPMMLGFGVIRSWVGQTIDHPTPARLTALIGVVLLFVLAVRLLRRWVVSRRPMEH